MLLSFDLRYQLAADLKFLQDNKGAAEVIQTLQLILDKEVTENKIQKEVLALGSMVTAEDKPCPSEAIYLLARCYQYGIGVPKNEAATHELYLMAANQGWILAELQLGFLGFDYRSQSTISDLSFTVSFLTRFSDLGYAPAQARLGMVYQMGMGVKTSPKVAAELFQKAVNNGYVPAQSTLGYCYQHGFGVAMKDTMRAISLYRMPARSGNDIAKAGLNACVDQFLEAPVDQYGLLDNLDVSELALSMGVTEAYFKLGKLYETELNQDAVKSLEYYQLFLEKHANAGDTKELDESDKIFRDLKEADEREEAISPVVMSETKQHMRGFFTDYTIGVPCPLLTVISEYVAGRLNFMRQHRKA